MQRLKAVPWTVLTHVVLLVLIILAANANEVRAAETVHLYVGRVGGTEAFVAVSVSDGGRITGYVCDGRAEGVSLWGWFEGELTGGRAQLVSTNGHVLDFSTSGDRVEGVVSPRGGGALAFVAEPATDDAGFWRAQGVLDGSAFLGGWIALADGQQRGVLIQDGTTNTAALFGDGSVRIAGTTVTAQRLWSSIEPISLPAR